MAARRAIGARDRKIREELLRRGHRRSRGMDIEGRARVKSAAGTGVLSKVLDSRRYGYRGAEHPTGDEPSDRAGADRSHRYLHLPL